MVNKMKKISLIITAFVLVALLASCSDGKTDNTTTQKATTSSVETTEKKENIVRIAVDKSNLEDPEAFAKEMEEYGAEVQDITGTNGYLLLFSREEHKKLLDEKKNDAIEKFKEYEDNEEHYVDSIEYDDDFRNLKIYVNKEMYEKTGSTTGNIVVASSALAYQMYLEQGQRTSVSVIYSETQEVVSTFTLPMNLNVAQ